MYRTVIFVALAGVCFGSVTQFTWQDCGADPDRSIKIQSLSISPMPVELPGYVTFAFNANLTRVLSGARVELNLTRHVTVLGDIHIPCILGVGSCTYEYCRVFDYLTHSKDSAMFKFGADLTHILTENHIDPSCPIQPMTAAVTAGRVYLPDMGTVPMMVAAGDYDLTATIKDSTGEVFGCVHFRLEVKRKPHGFLFG